MQQEKDPYYSVDRVSNSFLTELKHRMSGRKKPDNIQDIFDEGSQLHYAILEPLRVDVSGKYYDNVIKMKTEAMKDRSLSLFINPMSKREVEKEYYPEVMEVQCKAKIDCVIPHMKFGLELKSTACKTKVQFDKAIEYFDIDRQCAFYMDIADLDMVLIFAVSKHYPHNCFKFVVARDDARYVSGKNKYTELLNYYKMLF